MTADSISNLIWKMAVEMRRKCASEDTELDGWIDLAEVALKVVRKEDKRLLREFLD